MSGDMNSGGGWGKRAKDGKCREWAWASIAFNWTQGIGARSRQVPLLPVMPKVTQCRVMPQIRDNRLIRLTEVP